MAELHLRFKVKSGKTVTRIGKAKDNASITFYNEGSDVLTVTVDQNVLADVAGRRLPRSRRGRHSAWTFSVAPGNEKSLTVQPGAAPGTEFKYTAQIGTSTPEDPIIIIEK